MAQKITKPIPCGTWRKKCETVLFGVKNGDEAWKETVLCTQPERFEAVKKLAAKDGWGQFRIAKIDLSAPPNFAAAVKA